MILRALAYAGLMFLWAMLIAVALVTFGCAAPQPGWLDWWNTDQSVPPPPMGEPIDAPTTATVAILTLEDAPIGLPSGRLSSSTSARCLIRSRLSGMGINSRRLRNCHEKRQNRIL